MAVLLPLAVVVGLALQGTRAQLKAAWADAREEAERLAPVLAEGLAKDLQSQMVSIPTYADPPLPGTPSELDAILDGENITDLETLRDNPQAGLSPAGLPRRALAALRIHSLDRSRQRKEAVSALLIREAPSALTKTALKRLPAAETDQAAWRETEAIRSFSKRVHDPEGEWIRDDRGNRTSFIRIEEDSLKYVTATTSPLAAVEHSRGLPRWAFSHVYIGESRWPVLAATPVDLGKGMMLGISPYGYGSELEAPIRRQQRWTFAMLGAAVIAAAVALWSIHRTLRRERKLNEMKSQFVASVSHELRAPVASIRLMADALEEGKVPPETAKEFHRLIAREGTRLSTLVANVLDHARIEQGRRIWKMEPCDLPALVADTMRLMEPLAKEKEISLESRLTPVEATVDADAIQQALVNLLDNAIKFSPAGGRIEVILSNHDEPRNFSLAVKDEGPGVPKDEQVRIFERFYRPGDELRRETQGTGIGLSLVKSIAEAHHGSVSVTSEPGQGSTFTLSLPR